MEKRTIEIIEGSNTSIVKVEAHIFYHPLDETIEFGVHKTIAVKGIVDDTWSVTHIETGCSIDKGYASKQQAIKDATDRLNKYLVTKELPDALNNFNAAIENTDKLNKVKLEILYGEKK